MKTITIKNRKNITFKVIVDDDTFEWASKLKWNICRNGYARRSHYEKGKLLKTILLHREVIGAESKEVDHKNGNTLDNRRKNLRLCDHKENMKNRKGFGKSQYKGVSKQKNKWQSAIKVNGKQIYLGVFSNEIDAAKAYNKVAKKYQGEFAFLNNL